METTQLGKYNTFYVIEFLLKCQVYSGTTGPEDNFKLLVGGERENLLDVFLNEIN